MFIDSHCHLDFPEYRDRMPEVLANMAAAGVSHALCISVDLPDFPAVKALAETYAHLYASVGVHPDYENTPEPTEDFLVKAAEHPKIIALGETGLDYYRSGERPYESMEWQRQRFRTHIRAAIRAKKPLIIHTRSASEDTLRIMQEEGAGRVGGVMHCFTESTAVALAAIEMGFYISFSGIVTFKNADELRDAVRICPLDRLLVETDSPFLTPVPHRGEPNRPALVSLVGIAVANVKGVDVETVAAASSATAEALYRLP